MPIFPRKTPRHGGADRIDPEIAASNQPELRPPREGLFAHVRDDMAAALLELVGTTVFLLLAFGGVQSTQGQVATGNGAVSGVELVMYDSLCFGFSLLVSAWLFYRVTGGLFNPNVSLALLLTGIIGPVRFVLYCIAQLVGGIIAAALVLALTPGPLASNTVLAPGVNHAQGVFIEMFVTATLVLAVLMLAAEKHQTTPFAPVGIGLTLFTCELWSIYYTGGAANTARAFGPAVVTGFPDGGHWVYWVGPFLGSLLGASFYAILKHYRYWRLNPGQDTVEAHQSPTDPVQKISSVIRRRSVSVGSRSGTRQVDFEAPHEKRVSRGETSVGGSTLDGGRMTRPNDSAV